MTPEQLAQFNQIMEDIRLLKDVKRDGNIEQIIDKQVIDIVDVTDANVTNTIGGEGGDTFDYPAKWEKVVTKGGKVYLRPLYEVDIL